MIQFDCPKCLQQINARDQQAGHRVDCPGCAVSLLVPAPTVGNFDDLFDSDESIASDERDTEANPSLVNEDPPTILPQLIDDSIDDTPRTKVQRSVANPETAVRGDDSADSSDIFEDLQFPATPTSAAHAGSPDASTEREFANADPFEIDQEKRLVIDGITDTFSSSESFSVKCPVCDSHLFVTMHAVGTDVKCTDCFSKITVAKPTEKQIETAEKKKSKILEAIEPPIMADSLADEIEVDPSFGLAPVARDLLAPFDAPGETEGEDNPRDPLFVDDLKLEPLAKSLVDSQDADSKNDDFHELAAKRKRSTPNDRDLEKSNHGEIDPYRSRSAQVAKRKKRRQKMKAEPQPSNGLDFPTFEFDSLFGETVQLVGQTNVAARCVLVALLLAAGNIVGHFAVSSYAQIEDPTLGDKALMVLWRIGVGWLLFGVGTILLWYLAGVVFRKTAAGQRRIDSWKIGPSTEWTSTFLLIGFSFAIAGCPLMMFGATWLNAPLRFFLALPMLVSVWYTQSPFHIVSVDAFGRLRWQRSQWKSVGLVVFALASIAFTAGLMMAIPIAYFNILTSTIGAVVLSFTTLGYAAVAGWHSGKVVEELN